MSKLIIYHEKAKSKLQGGVNKIAQAVGSTLGPKGQNVALERQWGSPTVIHDGVTVAKEIDLKDPFENIGSQLVKDAAQRTNDRAGDGTTTSVILAQAIVNEGLKVISTGVSPMMIRRGLEKAMPVVVEALKEQAKKVKTKSQKYQIAGIAAGDEEIGKTIADTVDKVGVEGVVTVEESNGLETEVEYRQGMEIDMGYISPNFITNPERLLAEVEEPYILLTDYTLTSVADMMPFFNEFSTKSKRKALVVVAEKIEGSVLASMVVTKMRGMISMIAINAPGVGDAKKTVLEDLASLTGATIISQEAGFSLDEIKMEHLGKCEKVISDKSSSIFQGGDGDPKQRIKEVKAQMEKARTDFVKEKLEERLAKLSSGIAVISVGASTIPEMKEKKERVNDAVNATKAAIAEGYVIGGALSMIHAAEALKDLKLKHKEAQYGVEIIRKALSHPFKILMENSGQDHGRVIERISQRDNKEFGYNVVTGKIENLVEAGVIDPVKVVRLAFENAVSVATIVLTTSVVVCDDPKEKKDDGIPR